MAFNLRARLVRSFEDAQQNFEQIASALSGNFLRLAVGVATGRSVAFGTASMVFTASATAADNTVSHDLGKPPVWIVTGLGAIVVDTLAFTDTYGDTTFRMRATQSRAVAVSGTQTVHWLAIG